MGYKTWAAGDLLTAADVMAYLMKQVDIKCTSTTRPASPIDGMLIFETDTRNVSRYDASSSTWRTWPGGPTSATDSTNLTGITSTSYIAGSPAVSLTFTAPMSGYGVLWVKGNVEGASSEQQIYLSTEIRQTNSSGTVVVSTDDSNSISTQGVDNVIASNWRMITGLTPGGVYYARTMHRMSGGTGSVFYRGIMWQPSPN